MRETPAGGQSLMIWGDENRDAFPDAVNKNGQSYRFIDNLEDEDHSRQLLLQTTSTVSGGPTPGPLPQIRNIDWLDFNGDTRLDLVVFGSSVRIHTAPDDLNDIAQLDLDCDPPNAERSCTADPEPDTEAVTFTGAAFASAADPGLVIAVYPGRKLFRARSAPGTAAVTPLAFPNDTCTCPASCTMCPGMDCKCTYDCSTCATIAAVVVRDLDGDHQLDIVAIDSRLRVYVALAPSFVFGNPTQIVNPLPAAYDIVDASVAGAPMP
jgi:hypothetical protein